MIVVGIIGVLAAIAIPAYQDYVIRSRVIEGVQLAVPIEQAIDRYYARWGDFPPDNVAVGLTPPETLRGASVERMEVHEGVISIRYSVPQLQRKNTTLLVMRPALHPGNRGGAMLWVCAGHEVAEGFEAVPMPDPTTTIPNKYLPQACRAPTP